MSDVTGGNLFADQGAGDDLFVECDGRVDDNLEAIAHAEFAKEFDVAKLTMAEMEIVADDNGAYVQLTDQDFIHKIFR